MSNVLVVNPDGARVALFVSDLSGNTFPSLVAGGGQMSGPETISGPTNVYLAAAGEVLVSMTSASGAEVASAEGVPLRVMVSGTVTVHAHLENEQQAGRSAGVGGWPGDMRPFPGHWYGPRITGSLTTYGSSVYQCLQFTPVTVVDGVAAIAFRAAGAGTSDPVTVALYNSDHNNWPSTLVWSAVYDTPIATYECVSVTGPDVSGQQPTIPDGLYWLTIVSFDDVSFQVQMLGDYNSGYSLVGNAPFPSFGADETESLQNTLVGSAGQCVIHATSLGASSTETVTELPTTVVPGVDNMGSYYQPMVLVKSAWGG